MTQIDSRKPVFSTYLRTCCEPGRVPEAIAAYRVSVRLQPDFIPSIKKLRDLGKFIENPNKYSDDDGSAVRSIAALVGAKQSHLFRYGPVDATSAKVSPPLKQHVVSKHQYISQRSSSNLQLQWTVPLSTMLWSIRRFDWPLTGVDPATDDFAQDVLTGSGDIATATVASAEPEETHSPSNPGGSRRSQTTGRRSQRADSHGTDRKGKGSDKESRYARRAREEAEREEQGPPFVTGHAIGAMLLLLGGLILVSRGFGASSRLWGSCRLVLGPGW